MQGFKSLTKGRDGNPGDQGRHPLVPESFRDRGLHPFHTENLNLKPETSTIQYRFKLYHLFPK